jgi:hypothetical protein
VRSGIAACLTTLALAATACAADGQAPSASTQSVQEQPMSIVYQRSGGFAGFLDELRIDGDTLIVTRKKKEVARRTLTADEKQSLEKLKKDAEAAPAPGHLGHAGADTFTYSVTLGSAASPQLVFTGHAQAPNGLSPQWEALVEKLQALFTEAISHH